MRFKFIVCKVLQKEAYFCAARSKNTIDIVLMAQGLHNEPDKLRTEVQDQLNCTDDAQGRPYDATLLGYGLCSNGIIGLSAKIPIIVPRGHDCITLLLGSKEKYRDYFDSHRGIYWYSPGWIDHNSQPSKERYEQTLKEYRKKYGDDNAEYLMEMEQGWFKEYSWATFVDWNLPGSDDYKKYTRQCAEYLNWKFDELKGDSSLMQRFVDGKWDDKEFLTVPAGKKIAEDLTTEDIITTTE
jgi:hypothetical protein